jgi:hypothetical protein
MTDAELNRLRTALKPLAAADAPELLAAAREDARRRVRALLSEVLVQEMLEASRMAIGRPAQPIERPAQATPSESSFSADGELGLYLYGVTRSDQAHPPSGLSGIDERYSIEPIVSGELGALVSQVPLDEYNQERLHERLGDMESVERLARRHEVVVEALAEDRPLIPVRLCSIYRTPSGVREMLSREASIMKATLAELGDRAEWGIKVFAASRREAPVTSPSAATGADYLEGRRQARAGTAVREAELTAMVDEIHEAVSGVAHRSVILAPQRPEVTAHAGTMVLNTAYLVENSRREQLTELVARLQDRFRALGLQVVLTGPWPAYNFVPDEIGVAA